MLREYKSLTRRKRKRYRMTQSQKMCALAQADPRAFWQTLKATRQKALGALTPQQWHDAFRDLYDPEQPDAAPTQWAPESRPHTSEAGNGAPKGTINSQTDCPITLAEVVAALDKLKRHKAAGIDGILPDFLKDGKSCLVQPLCCLFNKILDEGLPVFLSMGIIHPIYKKGDPDDPANYRGITVGMCITKLLAMIFDDRIHTWSEGAGVRADGQAGFRRDHRTVDNIFILRTLIEQCKGRDRNRTGQKKKLYVCFVDFKKAFDTVPRDLLWQALEDTGMGHKMMRCIKSIYDTDTAGVHTQTASQTPSAARLASNIGSPMSRNLFGLYLDDLQGALTDTPDSNCPMLGDYALPLLLYADDLAILSHSEEGLQRLMDALEAFCHTKRLTFNIEKTKAMVTSQKATDLALTYQGLQIEKVQAFRYLGLDLHQSKGFTPVHPIC